MSKKRVCDYCGRSLGLLHIFTSSQGMICKDCLKELEREQEEGEE